MPSAQRSFQAHWIKDKESSAVRHMNVVRDVRIIPCWGLGSGRPPAELYPIWIEAANYRECLQQNMNLLHSDVWRGERGFMFCLHHLPALY